MMMYGETFYGRHTVQHQLQYSKIKVKRIAFRNKEHTKNHEHWRLGLIESHHMQHCSLQGCIRPTRGGFSDIRFSNTTKTYLYNVDPLKPHFCIVKLGFTGVYIVFLISAQKQRLSYSLEPPRRGGSNEYPQSMFWAEIWKISVFIWFFFHFLVVNFSV